MAWFRVDDTFHSHPKVRAAGLAAAGLWGAAGSYCMAYKTDGFIPDWWINSWGAAGKAAARKLVEVGLWEGAIEDIARGYRFHDWSDYQASSDEVERDREFARERQRRRRDRVRAVRDGVNANV